MYRRQVGFASGVTGANVMHGAAPGVERRCKTQAETDGSAPAPAESLARPVTRVQVVHVKETPDDTTSHMERESRPCAR